MKPKKKKQKKLSLREFWVEYLSIYTLTIMVTTLIQVIILDVEIQVLLTCLIKSMFTNMIGATLVMLGLRTQIIRSHKVLMALVYSLCNISYLDIFIVAKYGGASSVFEVFISYFVVYFILGFFIDKYVKLSKKILNRIFNNGSQQWLLFLLKKKRLGIPSAPFYSNGLCIRII